MIFWIITSFDNNFNRKAVRFKFMNSTAVYSVLLISRGFLCAFLLRTVRSIVHTGRFRRKLHGRCLACHSWCSQTFMGFWAGSAAADLSGVFAVEIGAPGTGLSKRKYSCFQNVVHDEFSFRWFDGPASVRAYEGHTLSQHSARGSLRRRYQCSRCS